MTPDPQLVAAVRQVASLHGLDATVMCALVEQETLWNPWVNRYEQGFENDYGKTIIPEAQQFAKTALFEVSTSTEIKNRCNSWGLGQILGQTAREFGFTGEMARLTDPQTGLEYACRKFADCLKRSAGNLQNALARYNGGSNPLYSSQVIERMAHYTGGN